LVALRFFGWDNPKAAKWYVKTMMSQFDAESWLRTMETMEAVDATDEAGRVSCPVLVMIDPRAIDRRQVERAEYIRRLAATLPDGELVVLKRDGSRHGYGEVVESFLARGNSQSAAETSVGMAIDSSMRSVLFTDLVGHTEMMSRLGDERGRQVLREHERITREVLASHGGTEVKTMGDGFMASFGSVTRAVECAVALQRAFADHEGEPLSVRVGLNAGEPIEEEGDLFGATVILASRIAGRAGGGEILVSDTVRGLCSGKGFLFSDRGEFAAKGFEEPVRVYEVKWRE
jgi:class 3 adenylate cyclase